MTIIYSNESFELWYLLHLDYVTSALSRTQLITKLELKLGIEYKKNSLSMYNMLHDMQQKAIDNAKRLQQSNLPKINPCTNVDVLVEELNKL